MRGIIYIDRNSLYFYGGNINKPVSLVVPTTILQDIEVIDDLAFKKLVLEFFKKYTIKPLSIIICFSTQSYFKKELQPQKSPQDISQLLSDFADIVPFNRVLANVFAYQKKQAIIAINRDIAYVIRDAIEPFGFKIEGIIPTYPLFGDTYHPFSLQLAQSIMKHFSSLHAISFLVHESDISKTEQDEITAEENEFSGKESSEKTTSYLPLMLAVFGLLMLVLIYMFFFYKKSPNQQKSSAPLPSITQPPPAQKTPSPSATNSPPPKDATSSAELTKKSDLTIHILNGSGIAGQAAEVQEALEEASFENITVGNTPTQGADNILIVVKETVDLATQTEIQNILADLSLTSRIRTNNAIEYDVLITTYNLKRSANE